MPKKNQQKLVKKNYTKKIESAKKRRVPFVPPCLARRVRRLKLPLVLHGEYDKWEKAEKPQSFAARCEIVIACLRT